MRITRILACLAAMSLMLTACPLTASAAESNAAQTVVFDETYTHAWSTDDYLQPHVVAFSLAESGVVNINVTWPRDDEGDIGDVRYALYRADSSELVWDAESYFCDKTATTFSLKVGLAAGDYRLEALPDFRVVEGFVDYVYTLRYRAAATECEPNDSPNTATAMTVGTTYHGSMNELEHDYDYWTYTVADGDERQLYFSGLDDIHGDGRECYIYHVDSNGIKRMLTDDDLMTDVNGDKCFDLPSTIGENTVYFSHYAGVPLDYTLRVTPPVPLNITKQPSNTYAYDGQDLAVTVKATGKNLKYTWWLCDKGSSKFSRSSITSPTYTVTMNSVRDGRRLYCVITDAYGVKVQTETVTIRMTNEFYITEQPQNVSVARGATFTVTTKAMGSGLKYQWYVAAKDSDTFKKSAVTGRKYSAVMSDAADGRRIYCIITDSRGNTLQTDTATAAMRSVRITAQPQDTVAAIGTTASTRVEAVGEGLKYQWYVKDIGSDDFKKSSVKSKNYAFTMTAEKSGRQVYCIITDTYGDTIQTDTVTMRASGPSIVTQPQDASAAIGETVTTFLKAVGEGLKYQWYVKDVGNDTFKKSSVKSVNYSYVMTEAKAGRQVYCIVTDAYGQTVQSDTVTLTIAKPKIQTQPTDAAAPLGEIVSTTVEATGVGLRYQWYFAPPGTSTFYKSSVTSATYSYEMTNAKSGRKVYCIITDAYGQQVKTDTVTLKKIAAPTIKKQPTNATAPLGETVSTTVEATGEGLRYQWYFAPPGTSTFYKSSVTSATYSYEMTSAKSGRKVYCIITDAYGQQVKTDTVTLKKA